MIFEGRLIRVFQARSILRGMTVKRFKAKYSGAMLGLWWAVATPLILAFSIDIIFTHVFKVEIPDFTLFVLSGIIPWLFFSNTVIEVTNSFVVDAAISKQGIFPREFIPASCVFANSLSFIIGIVFLLPLFFIANPQMIKVLPILALVVVLHLILLLGLGMIFSVLNAFSKDLMHFLSVGLMLWFWVTPVFYSVDMLQFPYRWVCLLNPLTYYVMLYRQILHEGSAPSLQLMFLSFLISLVFFAVGYWFFIKKESALSKKL